MCPNRPSFPSQQNMAAVGEWRSIEKGEAEKVKCLRKKRALSLAQAERKHFPDSSRNYQLSGEIIFAMGFATEWTLWGRHKYESRKKSLQQFKMRVMWLVEYYIVYASNTFCTHLLQFMSWFSSFSPFSSSQFNFLFFLNFSTFFRSIFSISRQYVSLQKLFLPFNCLLLFFFFIQPFYTVLPFACLRTIFTITISLCNRW